MENILSVIKAKAMFTMFIINFFFLSQKTVTAKQKPLIYFSQPLTFLRKNVFLNY